MFEVTVIIKEDGKELIHLARSVEPIQSTGLSRWTKAPDPAAEVMPLALLDNLQLFFASVNQDNCSFTLSSLGNINLMRNGLILVVGGSLTTTPLGRITYNGAEDATIRFLGAGT